MNAKSIFLFHNAVCATNPECADRYFAGVLNMFLVDTMMKHCLKNNFTRNYQLHLFELYSWIACSADSSYYRQIMAIRIARKAVVFFKYAICNTQITEDRI